MSGDGTGNGSPGAPGRPAVRRRVVRTQPGALSPRARAGLVSTLRGLSSAGPANAPPATAAEEHCELCGKPIPDDHRHLLHLDERRIVCTCESCWSLRSGDAEYRPAGSRTLWLADFVLEDELWARMQIPIGLAFFMCSGVTNQMVALYPSPAGATECELPLEDWTALVAANPVLDSLEPDCEALIVNRIAEPAQYAIAPIDACYRLVGLIKSRWEGISGGSAVEDAVPAFFAELRAASPV
jgi:Family of unknown function (DUF5947)